MTTPQNRVYVSDADRAMDMVRPTPRQRVSMNRATPLALTGAWQPVPFAPGSSAHDVCTFPESRFDYTGLLIRSNPATTWEQPYLLSTDLVVKVNAPNTAVKMAVRFVVPRPAGLGGPVYFPLPDSLGCIDLPDEITGTEKGVHFDYMVHSTAGVRAYGAQLQVRATSYQLSGAGLLGGIVGAVITTLSGNARPTLTDAVLNMFAV